MQTGSCGKSQSYYVVISLIIIIAACNFIREQICLSSTLTLTRTPSSSAQQWPFVSAKTAPKLSSLNISDNDNNTSRWKIFSSSSFSFATNLNLRRFKRQGVAPPATTSHKTPVMEETLAKSWLEMYCSEDEHEFVVEKSSASAMLSSVFNSSDDELPQFTSRRDSWVDFSFCNWKWSEAVSESFVGAESDGKRWKECENVWMFGATKRNHKSKVKLWNGMEFFIHHRRTRIHNENNENHCIFYRLSYMWRKESGIGVDIKWKLWKLAFVFWCEWDKQAATHIHGSWRDLNYIPDKYVSFPLICTTLSYLFSSATFLAVLPCFVLKCENE